MKENAKLSRKIAKKSKIKMAKNLEEKQQKKSSRKMAKKSRRKMQKNEEK